MAMVTSHHYHYFTQDQMSQVAQDLIPEHVAIIMDGNRRWAKKQACNVTDGHRSGADSLMDIIKSAKELGMRFLTLFVFSTENWNREAEEVAGILWLFEAYIRDKIPEMVENRIRFQTIGDLSKFPPSVLSAIHDAKLATETCESMEVIFAMNYGARDEIKRAVQKIIKDQVPADAITETTVASYLDTACYPDPDLLIRTSGELRISNFLLWQLSYAEIYVTPVLWPDFTPTLLLEAVLEFQNRERRIGL